MTLADPTPTTARRVAGDEPPHRPSINISQQERTASVLIGTGLTALGLWKRGGLGLLTAAAGGGMIFRGVTGHCYGFEMLGKNTAEDDAADPTRLYEKGVRMESAVTVSKPARELYDYWRDLTNLPSFMDNLTRIEVGEDGKSTWYVKGPAGVPAQWTAQVINDEPGKVIAWKTVGEADVHNAGAVRFDEGRHGTVVKVEIEYLPPIGGAIANFGAKIARLLGQAPQNDLDADLRKFKQLMEAGEVATTQGQPSGRN